MALLNKLESFLVAYGRLQNNHRRALEQTRFQAARTSYAHDRVGWGWGWGRELEEAAMELGVVAVAGGVGRTSEA